MRKMAVALVMIVMVVSVSGCLERVVAPLSGFEPWLEAYDLKYYWPTGSTPDVAAGDHVVGLIRDEDGKLMLSEGIVTAVQHPPDGQIMIVRLQWPRQFGTDTAGLPIGLWKFPPQYPAGELDPYQPTIIVLDGPTGREVRIVWYFGETPAPPVADADELTVIFDNGIEGFMETCQVVVYHNGPDPWAAFCTLLDAAGIADMYNRHYQLVMQ